MLIKINLTLFFIASICLEVCAQPCSLEVEVRGLRNGQGKLAALIFKDAEGFPNKAKHSIGGGFFSITLPMTAISYSIPETGTYAVSVFHDENGDKVLNTNFWGIPQEGAGTSNNPAPGFSAPSFSKAKFWANCPKSKIQIKMVY